MSKQKWYIIKDTHTCEYWDGSSDTDCWTPNINFAYFFYDKNDAIHTKDVSWDKDKFNDDCQVIELCEDDEDYQELKEENDQLKQQLAEKDKEIEKFVKYFELEACLIGRRCDGKTATKLEYIENFCQDIRHQICNEAKKRIVKETCYDTEEEVRNAIYDFNAREVLKILDDIEKGE